MRELRTYLIKDKAQEQLVEDYLQNAFIPTLHRAGWSNIGVFKPVEKDTANFGKRLFVLIPSKSLDALAMLPKTLLNDRESQLKIEKSAQSELAKNLGQIQEENSGLKEDLAFLRNIMSSGNVPEGLTIANLKIEADALPNEFRYRMLVTQGGQRKQDFKGKVQVVARVQQGAQQTTMSFPSDAEVRNKGGEMEFRYYKKVDGRFRIPEGTQLKSIQVRVLALPGYEVRSQKSVNL